MQPSAKPALTLTSARFDDLPGWRAADSRGALAAFRRSCAVILARDARRPLGGLGYAGRAGDWRAVCAAASHVGFGADEARKWFETWFAPFAAGSASGHKSLFTGYYEPQIQVARTPRGPYRVPIYGLPDDLVTADLGSFRSGLEGIRISGRVENRRLVPFPTRAEIDRHELSDAPVLLYASDPVALFLVQIQGSGRAMLEDGTRLRLAFAGQNGRPYSPIGRVLVRQSALARGNLSMQSIRSWLESHKSVAARIMETDDSYVFFRELPIGDASLGSPGSEGVPLTPQASIAVDPDVHALGIPMFVVADVPQTDRNGRTQRFARLCVAQDTGGAIKGEVRADIFWGFGADAESLAGHMNSPGSLYVLLPKALAARAAHQFSEARS